MDRSSKGNGNKERKMDLDYGDLQMVMLTKAIGWMAVSKAEEHIHIKIVSTKDSSTTA